jgi:type I restriction enzyme R subunit
MRNIRSQTYFEQMKGRGTRVISQTDFKAVTPDAEHKTHFVIVDAVGVCESDKTDTRPLERKPTVSFSRILEAVALGHRDEDIISTLAGRMARLGRELTAKDRKQIQEVSGGKNIKGLTNTLLDAIDPDKQIEAAKEKFNTAEPDEEQISQATQELVKTACEPFDNSDLRNTLIEIKQRNEQTIDTVSQDVVLETGFDEQAKEKAKGVIETFKKFIEDNLDEITALQIIYNIPHSRKHVTFEQINAVAEAIEKSPYNLTPELVWNAYERLEKAKVKRAGPQKMLTNIVSLLRFAMGKNDTLEPFSDIEEQKFNDWLNQQKSGRKFTDEQIEWLRMIKDHIATSLSIAVDDFEYAPFHERGGAVKAYQLFGDKLDTVLKELNEVLAA